MPAPEGTNGESARAWRHVNSGRYKSEDLHGSHSPVVLNQVDEKEQRKNRLRKFEDSRCARSYPRCRPRESRHHPRSYSALSSLRPQQVTSPHDVSVRALVAFPREKICCVVIVIARASPREFAISRGLRHPYSFEEHASPEGANWP